MYVQFLFQDIMKISDNDTIYVHWTQVATLFGISKRVFKDSLKRYVKENLKYYIQLYVLKSYYFDLKNFLVQLFLYPK